MRILLVSDFYPPLIGGTEFHVQRLAHGLLARGHCVQVLNFAGGTPALSSLDESGVKIECSGHSFSHLSAIYAVKKRRYILPFPDPVASVQLERTVREFNPQVIHAHGWCIFTVAALKRKHPGLPIVSTLHDYGFVCPAQNYFQTQAQIPCWLRSPSAMCVRCTKATYGRAKALSLMLLLSTFKKTLDRLDRHIAVSRFVAAVARHAGFSKVVVIPNFVDVDEMEQKGTQDYVDRKVDILYVGELSLNKGIDTILRAHERIRSLVGREVNLYLVGKEEGRNIMTGLKPNVKVIRNPPWHVIHSLLRQTKVVVVPSIWPDPCPTTALEAMAVGRPVVSSDVGGLPDIIVDRESGFLVGPNDQQSWANTVAEVMNDPAVAREVGKKAQERIERHFSSSVVIPQIEDVYKGLQSS
ncbi:MAG: glycosyltransferase family 4 protein [Candidatus Bathyarchaeia archaeon]